MSNLIQIKRSAVTASPSSLLVGEVAWSEVSDTLFIGESGAVVTPIGGPGTFAKLASPTLTGTPSAPTAAVDTGTTQLATTAFVVGQASSATPLVDGAAAVGASTRYARGDHVHPTDSSRAPLASPTLTGVPAAPTAAVDTNTTQLATTAFVVAQAYAKIASPTFTGAPAAPTAATGTNSTQLATTAFVLNTRLDQLANPTASVSLNGQRITSQADPIAGTDGATRNYVDSKIQGLSTKNSVRVASTANIAVLSGLPTVDGVSVNAGDRVLLKDQSTDSLNGIYVAAIGAWSRASDVDSWDKFTSAYTWVSEGTDQSDTGWVCTNDAVGTLGTTAITWSQFSSASQTLPGAGLSKTGNTLNVGGTASITVNADDIQINTTWVGQTALTTLGTVTTGTWQASVVAGAYGGLGAAISTITDGALVKRSGAAIITAVAGTDYLSSSSTIDGGTF